MRAFLGLLIGLAFLHCQVAFGESLLTLYYEALKSDPRLQVADAQAEIYQAKKSYSFGALLPQASISAQGTRTARETVQTSGLEDRSHYYGEKYNFVITQSLYNKSQWEEYRASRSAVDQYAAEYDSVKGVVTVDLVERYTQVLAAEDSYQFAVAERQAADKQLNQLQAQYERQLASITDLLEVEARRDRLVTDELDAANVVTLSRESISELIGREVTKPLARINESVAIDKNFLSVEQWIAEGLATNSLLESYRQSVAAAQAGVYQAKGKRHPTLNLQLLAQQSDIGFENSQSPETESYVASLTLKVPLFSGGQVSAQISEARARLKLAQSQLEKESRAVQKQIREAFLKAKSAKERTMATSRAVVSAEKSYEAQKKGFKYGTVTVVDILDASRNLFRAKRERNQAFYDFMVQSLSLYHSSGLLGHEHVVELSNWLISE